MEDMCYPVTSKNISPESDVDPLSVHGEVFYCDDDYEDIEIEDCPVLKSEVKIIAPQNEVPSKTDFSEVDEDIKMLREVEMIEVLSDDDDDEDEDEEEVDVDEVDVDVESVPVLFKYPRVANILKRPEIKRKPPQQREIYQSSRLASEPVVSNPFKKDVPDLTEEEKKTLKANGFPIPKRLPLTKEEQKALQIVRRKIRNKISSQESREKQKNYVKDLEERLAALMNENMSFRKKVHFLEIKNRQLTEELVRLKTQ